MLGSLRSSSVGRRDGGVKRGGWASASPRLHRHYPVLAHLQSSLLFLSLSDPDADLLFALTDRVRPGAGSAQMSGELAFRQVLSERRRFAEHLLFLLLAVSPCLQTLVERRCRDAHLHQIVPCPLRLRSLPEECLDLVLVQRPACVLNENAVDPVAKTLRQLRPGVEGARAPSVQNRRGYQRQFRRSRSATVARSQVRDGGEHISLPRLDREQRTVEAPRPLDQRSALSRGLHSAKEQFSSATLHELLKLRGL